MEVISVVSECKLWQNYIQKFINQLEQTRLTKPEQAIRRLQP